MVWFGTGFPNNNTPTEPNQTKLIDFSINVINHFIQLIQNNQPLNKLNQPLNKLNQSLNQPLNSELNHLLL